MFPICVCVYAISGIVMLLNIHIRIRTSRYVKKDLQNNQLHVKYFNQRNVSKKCQPIVLRIIFTIAKNGQDLFTFLCHVPS